MAKCAGCSGNTSGPIYGAGLTRYNLDGFSLGAGDSQPIPLPGSGNGGNVVAIPGGSAYFSFDQPTATATTLQSGLYLVGFEVDISQNVASTLTPTVCVGIGGPSPRGYPYNTFPDTNYVNGAFPEYLHALDNICDQFDISLENHTYLGFWQGVIIAGTTLQLYISTDVAVTSGYAEFDIIRMA